MSHEQNILATVADAILQPDALAKASARRHQHKVKRLHHHAFYCRDVEETRHFYEDILEFPLVSSMVVFEDPVTGEKDPYCHLFFEIGDSSCIAFFDYPPMTKDLDFKAPSLFHHHIALAVDDDTVIAYYRERLTAANIKFLEIDHGFCHSLYVADPNGLNVELTADTAVAEEFYLRSENLAHRDLENWRKHRPVPAC